MSGSLLTESRPTELWNGLEMFHRLGVSPKDWDRFRTNEAHAKKVVAVMQNQPPVLTDTTNGGITFARPSVPDIKLFKEEMAEFYGQEYGITKLPKISLPPVRDGFCWGLIMVSGITIEQDLADCAKKFKVSRWTNDDLDRLVVFNERSALKKAYAVWFRDRIEADQEQANQSANSLKAACIKSITLAERIRLERWFFWKTGKHLDISNWTRCSGSQCSDGGVPIVRWHAHYDVLSVDWYFADDPHVLIRTRETVS